MKREWIVLRDGTVWTDRLENEAACIYHIQESVETDEVFNEDGYEYRKMTKEESNKYNLEKDK